MIDKILEFLSFILVIILLIVMSVSSVVLTYDRYFNLKDYSYYLMAIGIIGFIIYFVRKIRNIRFSKFEITIFVLMLLAVLSIFTAINLGDALYGKINRREGLFVILTYYILTLNCLSVTNKKYVKLIIISIFFYSMINVFYGLYQTGILSVPKFDVRNGWHYARGFLGNSMFFGTLMAIFYGLSIGIFMKTSNLIVKLSSYVLVILASLGILMSGAMSVLVSTAFIFFMIFCQTIIEIIKKNSEGFYHLLLIAFCVLPFILLSIINSYRDSDFKNDVLEFAGESKSISTGVVRDNYGTGRIYIWKNTIDKIIEHKGIGVGIDNFHNAFEGKLMDRKSNSYVDKAHNDYLQKMLCEGVVSGTLFFIFLCYIFFKRLSNRLTAPYYGLFLAFTSYSVQAFFNISVTRVAPIYFVMIGLLMGMNYEEI